MGRIPFRDAAKRHLDRGNQCQLASATTASMTLAAKGHKSGVESEAAERLSPSSELLRGRALFIVEASRTPDGSPLFGGGVVSAG